METKTIVQADPGQRIMDAIIQALKLAAERRENVILIHNDKPYKVGLKTICYNIELNKSSNTGE